MSGHIVMVTRGMMCDVGQSAPTGGLLIGAGDFRRGRGASWLGVPRGSLESVRLWTLDEKYYMKYTSNTVNYRICVITLSKGLVSVTIEERTC